MDRHRAYLRVAVPAAWQAGVPSRYPTFLLVTVAHSSMPGELFVTKVEHARGQRAAARDKFHQRLRRSRRRAVSGEAAHEVRVSGCIADGCVILRCSCGASWSVESGHTIPELDGLAAQHTSGIAPGRPGLSPVPPGTR